MNKTITWRTIAPFILCALSSIFVLGCGGEQSTSSPERVVQSAEPVVETSVASETDEEPTPVPTQPLPNITVQELYSTEDGSTAVGEPYPAVDENGLPAPVVQEIISEPAPPTPSVVTDGYPVEDVEAGEEEAPAVPEISASTVPVATPPQLPQTSLEDHYWMIRPVAEGGTVWTDKFYPYGSTRGGTLRTHHGVEFNVGAYDVPILATANGKVIFAGADDQEMLGPQLDFYGNVVVIEHGFLYEGKPVYSLYAHLNGVTVGVGQMVSAGDVIGLSGASGVADAVHLHFEVRVGANTYESTRNPVLWLWPFPEDGTIVGRVTFPDGSLAEDYPVSIHKLDPGEHPVITLNSYADQVVNGDDRWPENFAFDDVEVGYYEVYAQIGSRKYRVEVQVEPRRTAYVDIVIGE